MEELLREAYKEIVDNKVSTCAEEGSHCPYCWADFESTVSRGSYINHDKDCIWVKAEKWLKENQ